jgi:hypothetical protein
MNAIEAHPRLFSLEQRPRGIWRLHIHGPHVSGWVDGSRKAAEDIAVAVAPLLTQEAAQ